MKIIYYCQHIWGVGHFFRSLEICKALAAHEIIMVTGGPEIDTPVPAHVRVVRLPGLMTDRNYSGLFPTDKSRTLEAVKAERQKLLYQLIEREAPEVFVVELYPFGRKAFGFELDPVLEGIRSGRLHRSRVACSLRDILVEKKDPAAYERRVVGILNRWFDVLLVHADPKLVRLDCTFSRLADIAIPVVYTGFITPKPPPGIRGQIRSGIGVDENAFLIIASAGGGQAGIVLLEPLVECFPKLNADRPAVLHVFTGPYMPDDEFAWLLARAERHLQIERFTPDFLSLLATADLSISMGGYNTSMNLLATRTPALIWPYPGDREQGLRADRLAQIGAVTVLKEKDLRKERLVEIIRGRILNPAAASHSIDLEGAINTARHIEAATTADSETEF